jgi:hypothetical protein
VRKTNEATGIIPLRLVHAVINQTAGGKVWLIETLPAREHCNVDPGPVHHPHVRREIGELGIEAIMGISILVHVNGRAVGTGPHQLGRCIVMVKIDDHFDFSEQERHGPSD